MSTIIGEQGESAASHIRTLPGEVLREEFMKPHGLSAAALARAIHVPQNRVAAILSERNPRAIAPDTALRLTRLFDTTPQFWLNLQLSCDLSVAIAEHGFQIDMDVRPIAA